MNHATTKAAATRAALSTTARAARCGPGRRRPITRSGMARTIYSRPPRRRYRPAAHGFPPPRAGEPRRDESPRAAVAHVHATVVPQVVAASSSSLACVAAGDPTRLVLLAVIVLLTAILVGLVALLVAV